MTLHLIKLAVGVQSIAALRARQSASAVPLRHTTRNFPRRAEEVLEGGSLFWVINRVVLVRQRLLGIAAGDQADGSKGCDLLLDQDLVPVRGRFVKPFQGWRYLLAEEAPPDEVAGGEDLPAALQRELARLGLL